MNTLKSFYNHILQNKKMMIMGVFSLALIALPLTVTLLQNQQNLRQLASTPTTITLEPIADTFVDSVNPDTNYGTLNVMRVDGSTQIKTSFLKFDLTELAGKEIADAKLRIMVNDPSTSGQSLKSVTEDNWDESITYKTQPAIGDAFATFGNTASNSNKNILITNKVNEEKGQFLSLAITSSGRDILVIRSKEASSGKPTLIVTYTTPPTPTEAITPTDSTPTDTISPTIPITDTIITDFLEPTFPPSTDVCASSAADIIIVIDKSLSMSQEIGPAKKAARSFVDKIAQNKNNKISLVAFDHNVTVTPLTDDFESVKTAISAVKELSWGTCIQCAIDKANTEFAERGRSGLNKSIVLLTDGRPTRTASGGATEDVAENAAFESIKTGHATHGYTLFNIGIGNGVRKAFMQETAEYTGGKYYHAPTSADLDSIYQNIATVIGKGSVSGLIFNDINNNGTKDASESGLTGWSINIQELNGTFNQNTTTLETTGSNYNFTGLCAGKTYRLSQDVQSGWRQTTPSNPGYHEFTITNGTPSEGKDFGNVKVTNCTDGVDNDSNGFTDRIDSSCHTDWNPKNPDSYNPDLDGEKGGIGESCADSKDNNKNNLIDGGDPICHTDGNVDNVQSYDPDLSEFDPNADVLLNLSVFLHGIGKSGDNRNPSSDFSNKNPQRPERRSFIEVYNDQNQLTATTEAMIIYASSSGSFVGSANIGVATTGNYTVKIKTEQHLKNQFAGIQKISAGRTIDLPSISLVTGDTNNDNRLDILDYNILYGCYTSDLMPTPRSCAGDNSTKADLDDEGKVNLFDLNLFIRELSVQSGA